MRVTCMKIKQRFANLRHMKYISLFNFCLGSVSKNCTKDEQSEISLNGNVYDWS